MSIATQQAMLKQLKDPFDPKFVHWRVGATNADKTLGIALAYIDSREVKKRLDDVCGIAGWQDRLQRVEGGFISEIDINIEGKWITRSNAAGDTAVEAVKGGASDAFKRAASKWGIGHYLYYLPTIWVPIKSQGRSYVLAETPDLPDWAKPNSNIERWEDIAEMEQDLNQTGEIESIAGIVIENIDSLRTASTIDELDKAIESLSVAERGVLVDEINTQTRRLLHESKIKSDLSQSATA